jgi:poly-gamma-glutamate capsule biosynthesis protein CapA/YwtB (metallophosphatase superfamily)
MSNSTITYVPEIEKKDRMNKDSANKSCISIAVVGDILMTPQVQVSAAALMNAEIADPYKRVASGFDGLFSKEVCKGLSTADLAFGNLETPIAKGLTEQWNYNNDSRPICKKINIKPDVLNDGNAYRYNSIRSISNAHPAVALALKNIGFNIVSTANNHFADRASNGIDGTIDSLKKANLSFVGTRKSNEIATDEDGYPYDKSNILKEINGIKIAFFAFTTQMNHTAKGYQLRPVLLGRLPKADASCSRQASFIISNNTQIEFNINRFCQAIKNAKINADIVIVSTHFGIWMMHEPSILQKKLAIRFLEAGADIIVGHGPHALQPIEKYKTRDKRITFIIYSLGNFLQDGGTEDTILSNSLISVIGYINLKKLPNGQVFIKDISYIPTFSYKNKDGNTQVVIARVSDFQKSTEILKTVFQGNKQSRLSLSYRYMSTFSLSRLVRLDDSWWERWILKKWKRETL